MSIAADYPYLRQRLAEEEAARNHGRHDSAATLRPNSDDVPTAKPSMAPLPVPTKENEFLGFCPSSVKLQNGDRKGALKKRTDYGAAFAASGVTTYYCSHKGCAYQGHVSIDFVWKAVMKDEKLGLKVRWAFLAKSHIAQKMVNGRQYKFQCPICIFSQGHAEGRIWTGVDIFMDHVSSHRGKDIPLEVLHKLNITNDRVVEDKEDFDLCLYPTQYHKEADAANTRGSVQLQKVPTRSSIVDTLWLRKASTNNLEGSAALSRTSTWRSDRADSVVEGAPIEEEEEGWAEGLSHFKVDREEDYLSPDF